MKNVSALVERVSVVAVLLAVSAPALSANEDLKSELSQIKSELASVTGQLGTFRTGELSVRRDIELTANVSFLQQWLAKISTPYAEISAVATAVEGDLFFKGGVFKAWIEHPGETNAFIRWSRFAVTTMPDRLDISGNFLARAQSRVNVHAIGFPTNILCETKPNFDADFQASLLTSPMTGLELSYTIALTKVVPRPPGKKPQIPCHLGRFGDYYLDFPVENLASVLTTGKINLGYSDKIKIDIPTNPPTTRYLDISVRDPKAEIRDDHIRVEADLMVVVPGE